MFSIGLDFSFIVTERKKHRPLRKKRDQELKLNQEMDSKRNIQRVIPKTYTYDRRFIKTLQFDFF